MAEAQYKNPRYWMGGDRGLITENDFVKEAEKRNYEVIKSSKRDDMYKHIDFYLKKNGKAFSVDVKARKKTSRSDKSFDDEYTWVEFKNVAGGAGWLYGEANYIVFEREKEFIFIDRKELLKFCLDSVEDEHVRHASKAIYKKYQRLDRKDVISRIKLDDAIKQNYFTYPNLSWEKSNGGSSN